MFQILITLGAIYFFKQKTAYEFHSRLEFRRVLFRSPSSRHPHRVPARHADPDDARLRRADRPRLLAGRSHRRLKALVTGANGQLGRALVARLGPSAHALARAQLDVTDGAAVSAALD